MIDQIAMVVAAAVSPAADWHHKTDWNNVVKAVAMAESTNNPKALNVKEDARGLYQIRKGVITDVNRTFGTNFKHDDAYSPAKAQALLKLYLFRYGRSYTVKTGNAPTVEVLMRIWNGGFSGYFNNRSASDPYISKLRKQNILKF